MTNDDLRTVAKESIRDDKSTQRANSSRGAMADIKVVLNNQVKKSPSLAMVIDNDDTVSPLGNS